MTGESKLNYWQQQEMFSSPPLPERLRSLAHFAFQRLPGVKRLRGGGDAELTTRLVTRWRLHGALPPHSFCCHSGILIKRRKNFSSFTLRHERHLLVILEDDWPDCVWAHIYCCLLRLLWHKLVWIMCREGLQRTLQDFRRRRIRSRRKHRDERSRRQMNSFNDI